MFRGHVTIREFPFRDNSSPYVNPLEFRRLLLNPNSATVELTYVVSLMLVNEYDCDGFAPFDTPHLFGCRTGVSARSAAVPSVVSHSNRYLSMADLVIIRTVSDPSISLKQ